MTWSINRWHVCGNLTISTHCMTASSVKMNSNLVGERTINGIDRGTKNAFADLLHWLRLMLLTFWMSAEGSWPLCARNCGVITASRRTFQDHICRTSQGTVWKRLTGTCAKPSRLLAPSSISFSFLKSSSIYLYRVTSHWSVYEGLCDLAVSSSAQRQTSTASETYYTWRWGCLSLTISNIQMPKSLSAMCLNIVVIISRGSLRRLGSLNVA